MKRILILILLLATVMALTASEGGHAEAAAHHFDWFAFIARILNAVMLFGGLFWLLRKPIAQMLGDKSLQVRHDMECHEAKMQQSETELLQLEERLAKLADEILVLKSQATEQGKIEKNRLQEVGKTESIRLLQMTEAEIDRRFTSAIKELKTRVADLTIQQFTQDFLGSANAGLHQRFIDRNIAMTGESLEGNQSR